MSVDHVQNEERVPLSITMLNGTTGLWGGERSMEDLTNSLAQVGCRIQVLVRDPDVGQMFDGQALIDVRNIWSFRGPLSRNASYAAPILRTPRNTVLLVFDFRLIPIAVGLLPLLRRRGICVVVDLHDAPLPSQRLYWCIRLARRADGCICVSEYSANQVAHFTKAFVVKRGVSRLSTADPKELSLRGAPLRVGLIGRIDREKELEIGVKAVALAKREVDIQLILRGAATYDAEQYASVLLQEAETSLGQSFRFEGPVAHSEVLSGIDVLLFCATREPSGRIVAEAQAAGVPVVVPSKGGVAEFVSDGKTGLVYEARSAPNAAAKLVELARDDQLRIRLASNAKAMTETEYDPDGQALKYLSALNAIRSSVFGRV